MSNLDFRTATQAQATAYTGDGVGTAVIFVSSGTATGTVITVNPALGADPETITVANPGTGTTSLNFARAAISGTNSFQFADGTILVYGTNSAESIDGDVFADLLYGNDGADFITGNNGDDQIFGGNDADTLLGGEGGDLLQGNTGADSLLGGNGNDFLFGGQGDDVLSGDNGNDYMQGNIGADRFRHPDRRPGCRYDQRRQRQRPAVRRPRR